MREFPVEQAVTSHVQAQSPSRVFWQRIAVHVGAQEFLRQRRLEGDVAKQRTLSGWGDRLGGPPGGTAWGDRPHTGPGSQEQASAAHSLETPAPSDSLLSTYALALEAGTDRRTSINPRSELRNVTLVLKYSHLSQIDPLNRLPVDVIQRVDTDFSKNVRACHVPIRVSRAAPGELSLVGA